MEHAQRDEQHTLDETLLVLMAGAFLAVLTVGVLVLREVGAGGTLAGYLVGLLFLVPLTIIAQRFCAVRARRRSN